MRAAKTRQAGRKRREAVFKRWLEVHPTAEEIGAFERERDETIGAQILWAAAQRGEAGIEGLRRRQLSRRPDCLLCHRPFSESDRVSLPR